MSDYEQESWEQVRARGRGKFILDGLFQRGLRFTIPFALTYVVLALLTHRIDDMFADGPGLCALTLSLTLLIGWGDGVAQWSKHERAHQIAKGRKERN